MIAWPAVATALLYLATSLALVALSHRLLRRTSIACGICLVLLPLSFTGRALLSGRVYAPYDLAYASEPLNSYRADYGVPDTARGIFYDLRGAIIPWHKAVRWTLAQGQWPLWNPFLLCGDPLAGSAQPAPYYPVNVIALLLPLPWSLTFSATLQFLLAVLGAFHLLRDLDCSEESALVGAAGWSLSSFIAFWIEWPLGAALSLAPLVILATRRLAASPGPRSAALLALMVTLAALAGHPESLAHLLIVGALFWLAETVRLAKGQTRRARHWTRSALWAFTAGLLSFGLAAIFLLPILEVLRQTTEWSFRIASQDMMHQGAPLWDAMRHFRRSLLPPQDASPGDFFLAPLASAYVGSVLWAPAAYGLWRGRSSVRYLFGALGVVGLSAGARVPGLHELLGRVPLLGVSLNERLVFIGALAVCTLAAFGLEAWISRGGGKDLGVLAAATAVTCIVASLVLAPQAAKAGMGQEAFAAWALWCALPAVLAGGTFLMLARAPRQGVIALLVILIIQRMGEAAPLYPTLPARAFYPRVSPLDALPQSDEPYRIVGHQFSLLPNDPTMWALEDARGYQAIHNRRLARTLPLWSDVGPATFNRVSDLSRPFLSFLNVRYAVASPGYRPQGWTLVRRGRGSMLWSNPKVLPRAFVPRRVRLGAGPDATLREMAKERDFANRAWIEPPGTSSAIGHETRERRNARGGVRIRRRGTGYRLDANLKKRGWVVVSETAWRGWRARTVSGRSEELPLGIANHAFLALELPAGPMQVDLFYRPRAFEIGLQLSTASLGVLMTWGCVAAWRRRKRGDPSKPRARPELRRVGDRVAVPGDYQYRALHGGRAPQRFWHRAKYREALRLLALEPHSVLLDAGCGSGLMSDLAAKTGATVLGVDANASAIEFARRTFARPGVEFRLGLVDELDLSPASFDRIVLLEVIEHLGRTQGHELLRTFHSLLRPGGRLVISTPNRLSIWPFLEWALDLLRLVPNLSEEQHECLYSLPELIEAGNAAGLRAVQYSMINTVAPWIAGPSDRLANIVHGWEVAHFRRHGAIMLVAFEKAAQDGALEPF